MQNTTGGTSANPMQDLQQTAADQFRGAQDVAKDASADLSQKANELAGDAKDMLLERADDIKKGFGGNLAALGGAIQAAREYLDEHDQKTASRLVGDAGDGLGRMAASLNDKSLSEFLDDLRETGRRNAGGLFAGSVLAGLALGRLLRASEGGSSTSAGDAAPGREKRDGNEQRSDGASRQPDTGSAGSSL